jgi:Asp-tRNA(Asn)/Glu-tRNA(Gln) amidotransferase A subunit family amidase
MATYDLESLKLPKLSGRSLELFAFLLDHRLTRALLLPGLLKQGGIPRLRKLELHRDPVLYPFAPVDKPATAGLSAAEVDAAVARAPKTDALRPGCRQFHEAYRKGTTTPLEVAERFLQALSASEASSPPLRAFIHWDREDLLAQARASTERYKAGKPLGILDGVPVAVKDEVDQAPYPSHAGTSFIGKGPAADCTAVARLRAAGALLVGKTTMNELGLDTSGFNATYGTVRNPWAMDRDPGGSSSGSAAATAAGLCPVSLGCDGGGSIRVPAALCGLVGLKPTFGRVSETGAVALCPSVDAIGPIAAGAEDAALVYGIIAGPDPLDPRSRFQPPVTLGNWDNIDLHGLRLGVFKPWFAHAAAPIVKACEAALARLAAAGAEIREVEIPGLDAMRIAHAVTIIAEEEANLQDKREHLRELGAPTRVTRSLALGFSSTDYIQAQRVRADAIAAFEAAFQDVDAIVTPTTGVTAPRIPPNSGAIGWSDLGTTTEKMRFVFEANLTGHPAISFPVGFDADGLPIGMHAMGRYWSENTLLRLARAAETFAEQRLPSTHFHILGTT